MLVGWKWKFRSQGVKKNPEEQRKKKANEKAAAVAGDTMDVDSEAISASIKWTLFVATCRVHRLSRSEATSGDLQSFTSGHEVLSFRNMSSWIKFKWTKD